MDVPERTDHFMASANPNTTLKMLLTLSHFSISPQLPDLILRPYISTSPALLILFGFASVLFKDVSSLFLCWEIAISAFYVSLGCSALPGQEEARQEAAIPPLSLPVLPSTSATDHDGHSLGEHKKQNCQSLSAHLTIYQGSKFASLQSSICRLNPIHALKCTSGATAASYSWVSPSYWLERKD